MAYKRKHRAMRRAAMARSWRATNTFLPPHAVSGLFLVGFKPKLKPTAHFQKLLPSRASRVRGLGRSQTGFSEGSRVVPQRCQGSWRQGCVSGGFRPKTNFLSPRHAAARGPAPPGLGVPSQNASLKFR